MSEYCSFRSTIHIWSIHGFSSQYFAVLAGTVEKQAMLKRLPDHLATAMLQFELV